MIDANCAMFNRSKSRRSAFYKILIASTAALLILPGCRRRRDADEGASGNTNINADVSETDLSETGKPSAENKPGERIDDSDEKDVMKDLLVEALNNFNESKSYYMIGTYVSDDKNTTEEFAYKIVEPGVFHYTYNVSGNGNVALLGEVYYQDIDTVEDMEKNILPDDVDLESIVMPTAFYNDEPHSTEYLDIYTGSPKSEEQSEIEPDAQDVDDVDADEENTEEEAVFIPYTREWVHDIDSGTWILAEIDRYKNPYIENLCMMLKSYEDVKVYTDNDYVIYTYEIKHPDREPFAAFTKWNSYAYFEDEPIELNVVVLKSDRRIVNATTESKTGSGGSERLIVALNFDVISEN